MHSGWLVSWFFSSDSPFWFFMGYYFYGYIFYGFRLIVDILRMFSWYSVSLWIIVGCSQQNFFPILRQSCTWRRSTASTRENLEDHLALGGSSKRCIIVPPWCVPMFLKTWWIVVDFLTESTYPLSRLVPLAVLLAPFLALDQSLKPAELSQHFFAFFWLGCLENIAPPSLCTTSVTRHCGGL